MNILPVTLMERTACFSMPRRASRRLPYVIAVFLAVFISSLLAGGAIPEAQAFGAPRILPYQGRLLDSSGTPLGGTAGAGYCFRFSFYTTPVVGAGTKLWPVGAPASMLSTVKNGLFALSIGDTSAGGDTLDFNFASAGALYLNVEVANTVAGSCTGSNFETLSPRQRIGAVAYALQSNSVAGSEPSVFGSSTPFTDTAVSIQAPSAATTPLKIRAASGQAVNLLEIQDALATRLLTVDSIGGLSSSSTLGVSGPARLYSTLMVDGLSTFSGGLLVNAASSTITTLRTSNFFATSSTLTTANITSLNLLGGTVTGLSLTNLSGTNVLAFLGNAQTFTAANNFSATTTFAVTSAASSSITQANIAKLVVSGTLQLPANSLTDAMIPDAITASNYLPLTGGTVSGLTILQNGFIASTSSSIAGGLQVAGALNASSTLFVKNLATFNAGFLSNATSTILGGLQVAGTLTNSGNLQVTGGLTVTGGANFAALSTFATTTIASGTLTTANIKNLTLLTGGTVAGLSLSNVTGTSGLSFLANNQVFTGLNNFTALTIFQSGLISSASSSFAKGLQVAGALNASSTLFVKNLATFNAGFFSNATSTILGGLQVAGTLTVSGAGSFSNLVTLSGGFTALTTSSISGPFSMTGPTTISASLLSSGLITTTGGFISTASSTFVSGLQVSGPLNASSTLLVKNLASFGSNVNISGNLNASGTLFVTGNILPGLNNVSNLGARGAAWGNVFASGTLEFSGGSASGGLRLVASNSTTTLISLVTGAGAGAFVLDTVTTLPPTSSTLLLSVRNNTKKVFSVDASGNVRTTGTITSNASGATMGDLAEYVDISPGETVEAGDIVVVDPDRPNKFKKSSTAYTLGVAGVISDTGRFLIGASGEGRAALGLAGLVKVKASNENGPISVGDYVVTASQPGLAMRFKPDDTHATAVVGVAVEPLTAETGTITIIISHGLVMPGASAGLRVDVIGSAGTELGILSDTVFFGRPYLNADSGGFALINPGDKFVAVSFEREYLDQPVVTASISLDDPALNGSDASFDSGATPEEIIFNNQMQYLIAKKSTHGFTILLNKPAPVAMRFSWQALAIKHPRLSVSGSALVATPSISIPVPSAATTPIEPAVPTMKNPPVSTAPDREAAPPNATSHAANPEPPAEVPTATPSE